MPFLTARWSNLVLITYAVPPELLEKRLAPGLELDTRDGSAFVSLVAFDFRKTRLVAFDFRKTRVLGVPWPGYRNFPEVNLRFYVREAAGGERGVMFVREFVPKRLIAWVARRVYHEPYLAIPMTSRTVLNEDSIAVRHEFIAGGRGHSVVAVGEKTTVCPVEGSDEHFFKEHRWGFGRSPDGKCVRYEVTHPVWNCHVLRSWHADVDWAAAYGEEWDVLRGATPRSVILAEGSDVQVLPKRGGET
jgi:uncharacterized protein